MLANETIIQHAQKTQTSELNVRREYFQHLFLSSFYTQEGMDKVFFKGGTALRLVYNSPRFSEDLDFDSPLADVSRIEDAILNTLSEIQKESVETELEEAKQTSGGYLSIMRFSALGHTVPIRIEISFRDRKKKGEAAVIASDLYPDYTLMQLTQETLIQGKIDALLARKKPRDFYDFYFLLRHNMIPENTDKKKLFQDVLDALHASEPSFDTELKTFLPRSHQMIVRDFKTTLEREVKKYI